MTRPSIGILILLVSFTLVKALTDDWGIATIALCVILVCLPPSFDPAIAIKEWQVKRGIHPESRKEDHG